MLSYAVLATLCLGALSVHVQYTDCGSKAAVSYVDISPCDNAADCTLKQGSSYTITIGFNPAAAMNKVAVKASATFWGSTIPLPVPQPDGCVDSGLSCPVAKGGDVVYHTTIPIDATFPTAKMVVKVELEDETGSDELCGQVNINIVS